MTVIAVLIPGRRAGRPPRAESRAECRVEITITATERADLGRVAEAEGRPVASVVRDAVNGYVAESLEAHIFRR